MKFTLCLAPAILLAACAGTPPPIADSDPPARGPQGECDVATLQGSVGERATQDLGAQLLAESGASTLRWGPPDSVMTMDFRTDRLNIFYDADMVIERIRCG